MQIKRVFSRINIDPDDQCCYAFDYMTAGTYYEGISYKPSVEPIGSFAYSSSRAVNQISAVRRYFPRSHREGTQSA